MNKFSITSNGFALCAILAVATGVATYTISCLLSSPTCALVNEGVRIQALNHQQVGAGSRKGNQLCQLEPLGDSTEYSYTKGRWVFNESISTYPYIGGEDFVWGPKCTHMEKEYLATGAMPDFLKYQWQPESCDLAPFDRENVCRLLDGLTIGVIGDSMQQQFAHSFIGLMLGHLPSQVTNPPDFGPLEVELCPYYSQKYSVKLDFRRWNKYQGTPEDRQALSDLAKTSDYLIVNWGVHYQPWLDMETATKDLIEVLEEHWQPPQKKPHRLFWRSTIVAHDNCAAANGPLESIEHAFHKNPRYNTDEIMLQQEQIVQPLLKASPKLDVTFLAIDKSTILRSDGHRVVGHQGSEDCLHYCEPGPTDSWVELFYHHVVMGV